MRSIVPWLLLAACLFSGPDPVRADVSSERRARSEGPAWWLWYRNHAATLEHRTALRLLPKGTKTPLFQMGGHEVLDRTVLIQAQQKRNEKDIAPPLRRLLDDRHESAVVQAAAARALARISHRPEDLERLQRALNPKTPRPDMVREAAALACGLLCRALPDEQMPTADLEKIREVLFRAVTHTPFSIRTRCHAVLAIGLLGTQGVDEAGLEARGRSAERLFGLLQQHARLAHPDLTACLCIAVGLHVPATITHFQRHMLREAAVKGTLGRHAVDARIRAQAVSALGRVGDARDIAVVVRVLTSRARQEAPIERACVVSLGALGGLVRGPDRAAAAERLVYVASHGQDARARNLAVQAIADLLLAELRDNEATLFKKQIGAALHDRLARGGQDQPAFAALALGRVLRAIPENLTDPFVQSFQRRSLRLLRGSLRDPRQTPAHRAAVVLALGVARDRGVVADQLALASADDVPPFLRTVTARALGVSGVPYPDVTRRLRRMQRDGTDPRLRREAATALGLLRDTQRTALFLEQFVAADDDRAIEQALDALTWGGTGVAMPAVLGYATHREHADGVRAQAIHTLGVLGDLEWVPTLHRLRANLSAADAPGPVRDLRFSE